MTIRYEFMSVIMISMYAEFFWEAKCIWPFFRGHKELGRVKWLVGCMFASTCVGVFYAVPMEFLSDPRLLGVCPTYFYFAVGGSVEIVLISLGQVCMALLLYEIHSVSTANPKDDTEFEAQQQRIKTNSRRWFLATCLHIIFASVCLDFLDLGKACGATAEIRALDAFLELAVLPLGLDSPRIIGVVVSLFYGTNILKLYANEDSVKVNRDASYFMPYINYLKPILILELTLFPVLLGAATMQFFILQGYLAIIRSWVDCVACFFMWMMLIVIRCWTIHSYCYDKHDLNEQMNKFNGLFGATLTMRELSRTAGVVDHDEVGRMVAQGISMCKGIRLSEVTPQEFGVKGFVVQSGVGGISPTSSPQVVKAIPTSSNEKKPQAVPCEAPDYFVSQSWHDDPDEKWDALMDIKRRFENEFGREPIFWIDKYCIDQNNIADNLKYLPIFIMASRKLLVLVGKTYFERLWCAWELFVYSRIYPDMKTNMVTWLMEGQTFATIAETSNNFKLGNVKCFMEADKERIMEAISSFRGGILGFEESIRTHGQSLSTINQVQPQVNDSYALVSTVPAP